jgi:hypothetical protein
VGFQDIPARHTQGADHQGAGTELVDPHRRSKALVNLRVHAYLVSRMGDVSRLDDLFSDVKHPCAASFMPFGIDVYDRNCDRAIGFSL